MTSPRLLAALLAAATVVALVPVAAGAAEPASGTVSPDAPEVLWNGGPMLAFTDNAYECSPELPSCDAFELTVTGATGAIDLLVGVSSADIGADIDLHVLDDQGETIASSEGPAANERVRLASIQDGTYTVMMETVFATPDSVYAGFARLAAPPAAVAGQSSADSVAWSYDPAAPQASAEVPLRVVLVGFEDDEFDEDALFADVPDYQRPGTFYRYGEGYALGGEGTLFGNESLVNHGRSYYQNNEPPLLPIEYRWNTEVVHAPDSFTREFFQHLMDESTVGTWHDERTLEYVQHYTAGRGAALRAAAGGTPVSDPTSVRWFDAEAAEDWVASNSQRLLGFETARTPGEAGYTVFFLNTWDSQAAEDILPADEYHHFLIERENVDNGDFAGIDWARVWGGNYRFMMVDLGAAPNPYESETWGNRNRSTWGSAWYDPPLWEYRANAPRPVTAVQLAENQTQAITPSATWDHEQLQYMMARTVNQAVNGRFFPAYLYEPRPGTGRFWLSDNVWHDAKALYRSDMTKLYDQEAALAGLSSLTPYFEFDGDVQYQYLDEGGADFEADQGMLEDAKAAGAFTYMDTVTAMDYIDANPERFLRGGECYTTVPTLQVVAESHYTWELPLIVAGIAVNRNGTPWGFLNAAYDLGKDTRADEDQTMALAHPSAFASTFTYTTVHEASHYLGLAHPHDMLGAARNGDGTPRYFDGFAWTFNSTASPTTYSHDEMSYAILDQETIARGHLSYYLQWTDEALLEAGQAFVDAGKPTLGDLTPAAAALRATAISATAEAEALYAGFDFVEAVYAAQQAWEAAAGYRDLALGLAPGATEFSKGTSLVEGAEPAACAASAGVVPVHDHGDHDHGAPAPLPATGGGAGPWGLALLGLGAVGLASRRLRTTRRPIRAG